VNADETEHRQEHHEELAEEIDSLLVAAARLGMDPLEESVPDFTDAESHLKDADRQALDAMGNDISGAMIRRAGMLHDAELDRFSTTMEPDTATLTSGGGRPAGVSHNLVPVYERIIDDKHVRWPSEFRLTKRLGEGGQGVVFLSKCCGFDDFAFPVALKVFSPERYRTEHDYETAMRRIAHVSSLVAQIHHESLLDLHTFVHRDSIRMLVMEWIDGYDLRRLLSNRIFAGVRGRVSNRRWEYINRVIVTDGPEQPRLKAGVAVDIIRDCLLGLSALHRAEIVHSDIKPSNIMLKRSGNAKIIDMGSAFEWTQPPRQRSITPAYAAPEVLEREECTQQSDLASLGYVLVELLAGRPLFAKARTVPELLEAKRSLPRRLHRILPEEVTESQLLMSFCQRLIAPDPNVRFPSAEEADLHSQEGAAAFHYQLVKGNLASVFDNDLRLWIEAVKEWDEANGYV
jgi:serine/threonine-protein kinase